MTNNPELFIKANDDGLDRYIESLSQDIKSLQESGVNESQLKGFHDVLQSFQQAKSIRNTAKNDLQFIRDNFKTFAGNNEAIDKAVDLLSRDMADFTKAGIVNDEIGPSNELIDNFKEILNSLQQAKESIFKDSQTFEAPKLETQQTFHQIPPNTLQTPTNMSSFGGLPPIPTPLSSTPTNSDSINAPKSHHINPSIQAKIDMIENNKSNQTINNEINRSTTLQNQNKMNALKKDFGNLISNLKGSSESNIDKLQKVNTFVENLDKNLNLNNVKDEKVLDNQIKLMSDMQALFQSTFANIGDNLGKYVGQQIKKSSIKSAQEDLASIPAYNVTRTLDVIITHLKDMKKSINNPEKMGYIEEDLHTMLQDRSKAIDNSKLLFQHMDMKNFTINGTPITPAVFAENNEMEKFIEKNKLQSDF